MVHPKLRALGGLYCLLAVLCIFAISRPNLAVESSQSLKNSGDISNAAPCQPNTLAQAQYLQPGDTLLIQRNQIFRGDTLLLANLGNSSAPITIDACGGGHDPVFTNLQDYSVANGHVWKQYDDDIYKLEDVINDPLLAPWGDNHYASHGEFNLLQQGDFADWGHHHPAKWLVSAESQGSVSRSLQNYVDSDLAIELHLPNPASTVSISTTVALEPDTAYVFKIRTLSDGNSETRLTIAQKDGETQKYLSANQRNWSADLHEYLVRGEFGRYTNDWLYFNTSPSEAPLTEYEITFTNSLLNGKQSATTLLDDLVIIDRKELNDNFQVATASAAQWEASGFDALNPAQRGNTHLADGLNYGEWSWDGEDFYYRLNPNESIAELHIEIGQGNWTRALATLPGIHLRNSQNISIANIDVRFTPKYGVTLFGANSAFELSNLYIQEADMGMLIGPDNHDGEINYSIAKDMFEYGFYVMGAQDMRFFNNVSVGAKTNSGFYFYNGSTGTMQNNIAAQNNQFSISCFAGITISHNIFAGSHDSTCPIDETNFVDVDPQLTDYFMPLADSIAIDAGVYVGKTVDHTGLPIVDRVDIGVFEFRPNPRAIFDTDPPPFSIYLPIVR